MRRQDVLECIAQHAAELHRMGARSLSLFGSFARDEAGDGSDVDLLVDLDVHTFDRYMDLKLRLEDLLQRRVDLVPVECLREQIRDAVLGEAIRAA
ncbi:MAG: nucleotidyltransferase domain-containing protein [Planctomycetes bacterium]|nr:nucleotidyltransferase domain-containing protein [Planctomycetota bacterium]